MINFDDNLPLFPELTLPPETDPFSHESIACKAGYRLIAGVDEAGRGPLAGPVVAAAVIIPFGEIIEGVKDSKKMTEKTRDNAFSVINQRAIAVSIGLVSHRFIDEHNILQASLEAMKRAVLSLYPAPDYLLVDGIHTVPVSIHQRSIIKGDQQSLSISAASIIAKVYRDRVMISHHEQFPEYELKKNKGYGTKMHMEAIKRYGASPIHRLTFKGVY